MTVKMSEKEKIEKATAEGFLDLFNGHYNATYSIIELGDAPDIKCIDSNGDELNIEITLTEDSKRDIQASMGRSDHRSVAALEEHNAKVAEGINNPQFGSLSGNVLDQVVSTINKKLIKRYGLNTALVVRDTSGADWEWEHVIEDIKNNLDLSSNPFDRGIWILNLAKTKLYQVV